MMRAGVRIGVDVGTVRVGIARTDPDALLATPLVTLARNEDTASAVAELAAEHNAVEIVVGLPLSLRGTDTASTADARAVARQLAETVSVPVRLVDERLSSVSAHSAMRATGRSQRSSRKVIDQAAAVVLLQQALDVERVSGNPPGTEVTMER